jgi:DUF4097 and DUF4098 domain-containing protein YvlB
MRSFFTIAIVVCLGFGIAEAGDTIERTFATEADKLLEVDLETGGSIAIAGWDKNEAHIVVLREGRDWDECKFEFNESPSGIEVTSSRDRRWRDFNARINVEIQVPRTYNLDITTTGGRVSIENITGKIIGQTNGGELDFDRLDGDISFHTNGGKIHASNIKGEVNLKTNGGAITFTDSQVNGRAHTNGGSIDVIGVTGNLQCTTNGGRVRYDNEDKSDKTPAIDDVVTLRTMGGEIDLAEAPYGADVKTNGGDISIKKAAKFVEAHTNGGDIYIDEVDGWVDASTNGGDVVVNVIDSHKTSDHAVDISSNGGEIRLTLPKDFSGQFDIELAYTKNARRDYKIISDFDIKTRETDDWNFDHGTPRKYIEGGGQIGDGANKVRIRTINGDVIIKKG